MTMRPFGRGDTVSTFRQLVATVVAEIDKLDNDYVLKASPAELEAYFTKRVVLVPLVVDPSTRYIESQGGASIDVSRPDEIAGFRGRRPPAKGTRLVVALPFTGAPELWQFRPSTHGYGGYPEIEIGDGVVTFAYSFADSSANAQRMKTEIDQAVTALATAAANSASDVENHNQSAPTVIREALTRKRACALKVTGAVAALGIPLKAQAPGLAMTLPALRRPSPIARPEVGGTPFAPEPVLEQQEFEHIISVLRGMSMVIERNPTAFRHADEETIRTHFLLPLNSHYPGAATGETFNASGKTDILIRVNDRNVFIAECKFWRGPKSFDDAIDQLLGYLSWRDSKCALLIFNRTQDSSAVREKMHDLMLARPECRKTLIHTPTADSRYIFVKASDPGREIQMCTLLFDVPHPETL
jgi:hypothetical protein